MTKNTTIKYVLQYEDGSSVGDFRSAYQASKFRANMGGKLHSAKVVQLFI